MSHTFSQQRSVKYEVRVPSNFTEGTSTIRIFGADLRFYIVDVNCLAVDDGPATAGKPSTEWQKTGRSGTARISPGTRRLSPSRAKYTASIASHSLGRILRNHIQHRLNVRRRAGDHAQNLAGGCLLLQRFGEITVPDL